MIKFIGIFFKVALLSENCFYYIIVRVDLYLWFGSFANSFFNALLKKILQRCTKGT